MTLQDELLANTPLPLDIIKYCIQPYLVRPKQWQNTFAHVLRDVHNLGQFYLWGNIGVREMNDLALLLPDSRYTDEFNEWWTIWLLGTIEY